MSPSPSLRFRLLRGLGLSLLIVALAAVAYLVWNPGEDIRDGRHDRGHNGLWLAHGWLGADSWFTENQRWPQVAKYRGPEALQSLATLCAQNHITDLFPHLCPCDAEGHLPEVSSEETDRFLDALTPMCRVLPWIGGPGPSPANYQDARWRSTFVQSVRALLNEHPRLHGIHLNIEPMPSGDSAYLQLLDELHAALPPGKILSVAAYPPPTLWQPTRDVHWDELYFRAIAQRADQLAVMMYDTSITHSKPYRQLMSDWTVQVLQWSEGKPVLLGLPAYEDAGVGYHDPSVENLTNGLTGIHAGLQRSGIPPNYQGVAIYSHWEMNEAKWQIWREQFLRMTPPTAAQK